MAVTVAHGRQTTTQARLLAWFGAHPIAYLFVAPYVIFMLGVAGMAAALGFPPSLAAFFVMSFGVAIIDAGLNSYIAGFPNNTGLLNYLHAFYGLGALIGPVVASGLIALGLPWPGVYVVWIAVSLPVALGLWLALKGEGGEAHEGDPAGVVSEPESARRRTADAGEPPAG